MPTRKDYTIIFGGDDLSYGYGFCIKIRRDMADKDIQDRMNKIERFFNWEDCHGHDYCKVKPKITLKEANAHVREMKNSKDGGGSVETKVIDWSSLASLETISSRLQYKIDNQEGWSGPRGCPVFIDVMSIIQK